MRPFGAWFGRLAMAGACLAGAGCGGGDVPDPDSDSRAAAPESSPRPGRGAAPSAPEPGPAVANNAPPPVAGKTAEVKAAEPEAPAIKGDASGTEEMLRIAGSSNATPPAGESAPSAAPPGPGGPPGGEMGGPGRRGAMAGNGGPGMAGYPGMQAQQQGRPGGPGGPLPAGGPGGQGGPMAAGRPGSLAMAGGMNAPGAPGGADSPGGPIGMGRPGFAGGRPAGGGGAGQDPTASMGAAAFNNPMTSVQAFLAALKAKDKDRLKQATAWRAATESDEKHRKIFTAILDQSISDDELDELSKALDGYMVAQVLPAKSSGRMGVVVHKMSGRDMLQRTIMTRKEKEGWKVLDVESMFEFKAMPSFRFPGRRR